MLVNVLKAEKPFESVLRRRTRSYLWFGRNENFALPLLSTKRRAASVCELDWNKKHSKQQIKHTVRGEKKVHLIQFSGFTLQDKMNQHYLR